MKIFQDFGVRAWLGTLIVIPSAGSLSYLAINGNTEAQTTLSVMAAGVVAYYFGQRSVK